MIPTRSRIVILTIQTKYHLNGKKTWHSGLTKR